MDERWIKVKDGGGRRERQDRREERDKLRRSDRLTAAAVINCKRECEVELVSNDAGAGDGPGGASRAAKKRAPHV